MEKAIAPAQWQERRASARLKILSSSVSFRGLSSAGRAPDLHSGGHRFDPDRLHQIPSGIGVAHRFVRTDDLLWQIARLHQPVVGKAQNTQEDRVGSSGG